MSATQWSLDPTHSQVEFSVKHLMISTVRGRFSDLDGSVSLHAADPSRSSVEVSIDVASIDTGVTDRDAHLRSADFFDVEQHPVMTFKSRRVEGSLSNPGDTFRVIGDLTLRGVTREVVLDATFSGTAGDPWGSTRAGFAATARIDRRDFGLTWNQAIETGGVLVGNEVKIDLQVEGVLVEEEAVAAV